MPPRNLLLIILTGLVSLACYLRASRNRYVTAIAEGMNIVTQEYVDEVDQRKLFEGAMEGMVSQLDDYSGYHPPREYEQFQEEIGQTIVGIGVIVEYDEVTKRLTINYPLIGTPAYKAGIKPGDVVLEIDGQSTAEFEERDDAIGRIKGPAGTKVKLALQRAGSPEPIRLEIERANIPVESVLGDLRSPQGKWIYRLAEEPRIGYIRVLTFGERTSEELREALATLRDSEEGIDGLILDLRGNEGGLLTTAVETCDMFLEEGTIVSQVGRNGVQRRLPERATSGVELGPEVPLIVMVDRFSASASEIVAACLQDHQRAFVGGQRSWGKGTVQNLIHMEGGRSAIRLTIARFVRPSGKNIHKMRDAKETDDWGVRPNDGLELVLSEEQYRRFRKNRFERDRLTSSGQEIPAADSADSSPPAAAVPPQPQPDGAANPPPEPTGRSAISDDPQLRQAIEHLRRTKRPSGEA